MTSPTAVDLFAGAGGATRGLRDAGFDVVGAVENDPDAAATFRLNHPATKLWDQDIRKLPAEVMRKELGLKPRELTLLKACPPCQGFSSLATSRYTNPERDDLVRQVFRFVRSLRPATVLIENVPGLARDTRFAELSDFLSQTGYSFRHFVLNATEFGVPQRRKRLVLLGIRTRRFEIPADLWTLISAEKPTEARTAGAALADLDRVRKNSDSMSRHRNLSPRIQERVKAIPVGGNRFDLPEEHRLTCHNIVDERGVRTATSSYGRVRLDLPAPTMTTRCTTPACGSFIHPTEHRGLTLREAAWFQSFPADYGFVGSYESIERQIGNAVPVLMADMLGRAASGALSAARMAG